MMPPARIPQTGDLLWVGGCVKMLPVRTDRDRQSSVSQPYWAPLRGTQRSTIGETLFLSSRCITMVM